MVRVFVRVFADVKNIEDKFCTAWMKEIRKNTGQLNSKQNYKATVSLHQMNLQTKKVQLNRKYYDR